ncbi:quinone-dependent dihydroorotate dehydrogenase [Conexibacter sp. DBS9H8]|uniref:quinone-dependent dihydroorotate dehydrogenase n=1 Tax=Conexibacter sp. DBS9H8 TaxID=2937801 RepID=UPI00200DB104|nr:quinone-dependent dihydroorotate dehydrogenase [Conexibacter sp. DBS9H8]
MIYQRLYDHVLVRIPAEAAHHWTSAGLRIAAAPAPIRRLGAALTIPSEIAVDAFGLRFASPLGVAAGLDKDATFHAALGALGFGSVEVGTVTPRPQPGNPRPRIARIPADRALINAMGFPSDGAEAVAARLPGRAAPTAGTAGPILGINLAKNRDTPMAAAADDYAAVAGRLAPLADYLVLNVSSPNTPGLRDLERAAGLAPLITAVRAVAGAVPLLVKISPDLADADVDAVAELAHREGLAGVIATNTTVDRGVLSPAGRAVAAGFTGGGVSGAPLMTRSLAVLARLHRALAGSGTVIVSVGGVTGAEDVWARILAGATLVQVYTGFVYGGPAWPARVNHGLAGRLRAAGVSSLGELVGIAA